MYQLCMPDAFNYMKWEGNLNLQMRDQHKDDFQAKVQLCMSVVDSGYEPSFVKELRDPHCRCNLRAIVSQELLFNLEPFKKVGRRHTQMYASKGIVCLLNTRVSKAAFFSP